MIKIYKTDESTLKLSNISNVEPQAWIHMVAPTKEEINLVSEKTGIAKSLFVKVLDEEEISRVEKEGEATLIVADIPYMVDYSVKNKYRTLPLGIIASNEYIVTILLKESKLFEDFENGLVKEFDTSKKTKFTIQLFLRISQGYLMALNKMNKDI